jgi:hypothetical protein
MCSSASLRKAVMRMNCGETANAEMLGMDVDSD